MPDTTSRLTLEIVAGVQQAQRGLRDLLGLNSRTAQQIRNIWSRANRENTTAFKRFIQTADAGMVGLLRTARRVASGITTSFTRAFGALRRSVFSLGGLFALAGIGAAGGSVLRANFQQQRIQAQFGRLVPQASQGRLQQFARQQGTGFFNQADVLEAVTTLSRELNEQQIRTVLSNQGFRGALAASGETQAFGATALFRAAFLGEAELVERLGISLTENAIKATQAYKEINQLTGQTLDQLNRQDRALLTIRAGLEQLAKFAGLERDLLNQSVGLWAQIRNRVKDIQIGLGAVVDTHLRNFLELLNRIDLQALRQFFGQDLGQNLKDLFGAIGRDIITTLVSAIRIGVQEGFRAAASVYQNIPGDNFFSKLTNLGRGGTGLVEQAIQAGQAGATGGFQFFPNTRQFFGSRFGGGGAAGGGLPQQFGNIQSLTQGITAPPTPLSFNVPSLNLGGGLLGVARAASGLGSGVNQGLQNFNAVAAQHALLRNETVSIARSMAIDIIGSWQQISAATDTMLDDVVGAFADLTLRIIDIVSSTRGPEGQLFGALGGLAALGPIGIGLGITATGYSLYRQHQSRRELSRNTRQTPRLIHAVR